MAFDLQVKRVYDEPQETDGLRILVDRMWPRGLAASEAQIDSWPKTLAPSTELRKWYQHDAPKWNEFRRRYFKELEANSELLDALVEEVQNRRATFLFSSREQLLNNAHALKEYIERRGKRITGKPT